MNNQYLLERVQDVEKKIDNMNTSFIKNFIELLKEFQNLPENDQNIISDSLKKIISIKRNGIEENQEEEPIIKRFKIDLADQVKYCHNYNESIKVKTIGEIPEKLKGDHILEPLIDLDYKYKPIKLRDPIKINYTNFQTFLKSYSKQIERKYGAILISSLFDSIDLVPQMTIQFHDSKSQDSRHVFESIKSYIKSIFVCRKRKYNTEYLISNQNRINKYKMFLRLGIPNFGDFDNDQESITIDNFDIKQMLRLSKDSVLSVLSTIKSNSTLFQIKYSKPNRNRFKRTMVKDIEKLFNKDSRCDFIINHLHIIKKSYLYKLFCGEVKKELELLHNTSNYSNDEIDDAIITVKTDNEIFREADVSILTTKKEPIPDIIWMNNTYDVLDLYNNIVGLRKNHREMEPVFSNGSCDLHDYFQYFIDEENENESHISQSAPTISLTSSAQPRSPTPPTPTTPPPPPLPSKTTTSSTDRQTVYQQLQPFQTHLNQPLQTHLNQPLQTHINQPFQTHLNQPLQTHLNQPIQTHINQPFQTHINQPIQTHMNQSFQQDQQFQSQQLHYQELSQQQFQQYQP
ncbi:hypothetical protein ACTFIR_009367 [Dictyostelium discoideum]